MRVTRYGRICAARQAWRADRMGRINSPALFAIPFRREEAVGLGPVEPSGVQKAVCFQWLPVRLPICTNWEDWIIDLPRAEAITLTVIPPGPAVFGLSIRLDALPVGKGCQPSAYQKCHQDERTSCPAVPHRAPVFSPCGDRRSLCSWGVHSPPTKELAHTKAILHKEPERFTQSLSLAEPLAAYPA